MAFNDTSVLCMSLCKKKSRLKRKTEVTHLKMILVSPCTVNTHSFQFELVFICAKACHTIVIFSPFCVGVFVNE